MRMKNKKKARTIALALIRAVFFCGLVGIRTPNLLIRSEMLYPVELQNQLAFKKALQR
jgi:hypothetical protein